MKERALAMIGLTAVLAVASCGGNGNGSSGMEPGTLGVFIADGPPDETIYRVEIDLDRIEAYLAGHWVRIDKTAGTINLLDTVDTPLLAATAPVSSGVYSRFRLFLSGARVEDAEGCHEVSVESISRDGFGIDLPFTVHGGQKNELLLDFDVEGSLFKRGPGQYDFRPAIRAVDRRTAGSVFGCLESEDCPLPGVAVRAVYIGGDRLTIGQIANTSRTRSDGRFRIWALAPGEYRLDFEIRDRFGNLERSHSESSIVVRPGEDTDIGRVIWPREAP